MTLGALIHEFGWSMDDHDRLAAGTLCGHIIECGAQCNGGNFTDWRLVPDYDNMGFPVAEVEDDGSFVLGKPDDTGGLITPATVAEQMLYEIGDPRAYIVPDVVCDFTQARYEQVAKDRVRVSGAKGRPASDTYKVSTTFPDGYKLSTIFMLGGREAVAKGRHSAEMIIKKTRRVFGEKGWADYRDVSLEVIGGEATYGPHARTEDSREVVVKIAAKHDQKEALALLGREIAPMSTGGVVGMTGSFGAGRVSPTPVIRMFSCLVPKSQVPVTIDLDGRQIPMQEGARSGGFTAAQLPVEAPAAAPLVGCRERDGAAGRARLWPLGRQGRQRQYRHLRPQARVRADPRLGGDGGGGGEVLRPPHPRQGDALAAARHRRLQLPAAPGAGRRRHGLAQGRSAGQGLRPDAARHAGARSGEMARKLAA